MLALIITSLCLSLIPVFLFSPIPSTVTPCRTNPRVSVAASSSARAMATIMKAAVDASVDAAVEAVVLASVSTDAATMPEKIKFYLAASSSARAMATIMKAAVDHAAVDHAAVEGTAIAKYAREFLRVMVIGMDSAATMSKLTRFTFTNISFHSSPLFISITYLKSSSYIILLCFVAAVMKATLKTLTSKTKTLIFSRATLTV